MSRLIEVTATPLAVLDAQPLAALWNEAYGDDLAITPRLLEWCALPSEKRSTRLFVAAAAGEMLGFAIASRLHANLCGWIDALAVQRGRRRPALRAALLDAAARWLCDESCAQVDYGGGSRSLLRGAPAKTQQSRILWALGYETSTLGDLWDMAVDVTRYQPPAALQNDVGVVRTAAPRDRDEIVALLEQRTALLSAASGETVGEPDVEALCDLAALSPLAGVQLTSRGRISDLMLLWTPRGLEGLCQLVFADSVIPIELGYPYRLPRQWAMLHTVVALRTLDGAGLGLLLDGALRRLHNTGVNACVATGVAATGYFTNFGFQPYRRWRPMTKRVVIRPADLG